MVVGVDVDVDIDVDATVATCSSRLGKSLVTVRVSVSCGMLALLSIAH